VEQIRLIYSGKQMYVQTCTISQIFHRSDDVKLQEYQVKRMCLCIFRHDHIYSGKHDSHGSSTARRLRLIIFHKKH